MAHHFEDFDFTTHSLNVSFFDDFSFFEDFNGNLQLK